MSLPNGVDIVNITSVHYEIEGRRIFSVMGCGTDNQIYRWSKTKGDWNLFKSSFNTPYERKKEKNKKEEVDYSTKDDF